MSRPDLVHSEPRVAGPSLPQLTLKQRQPIDREAAGLDTGPRLHGFPQGRQAAAPAYPTERNVRMEATLFLREPDLGKSGVELGVQRGERRVAGFDADPENAGAAKMWETSEVAQSTAGRSRGASDPAQDSVDCRQLTRLDVPQELQGQVHRIGLNPTNVGTAGAELGDDVPEPLLDGIRQIYGDK